MTDTPTDEHALPVSQPAGDAIAVVPADSNIRSITLWLHGRAARTQRSYRADTAAFLGFVQKPLRQIILGDLQAYQDSLVHLATASQARRLSAVKSLLIFGSEGPAA
jgi:Phage integrase, N-terminal SAM-like domain